MSINISRYIRIASTVSGATAVNAQKLVGRRFTTNPLLRAGEVISVIRGGAEDFFGADSEEAQFARQYFGYISPAPASQAESLQFASWVDVPRAATIVGKSPSPLNSIQTITAGHMKVVWDGNDYVINSIDLSGATDFISAASIVENALDAVKGGNPVLQVTYNTDEDRFELVCAQTGKGDIEIVPYNDSNDIAAALGLANGDVFNGAAGESALEAFQRAEGISDSFGSASFGSDVGINMAAALSDYVAGNNVKYVIYWPVKDKAEAQTWSDKFIGVASTGLVLNGTPGEYKEALLQAIQAATDYERRNASINFMFRQNQVVFTADVTTDSDADYYDALRVNYYGETATAGQRIAFMQRGVLCGGVSAPTDIGVHSNEQWLKAYIKARLMSLLLGVNKIPANLDGKGMVLGIVQGGIDKAIFNGTILIGKSLTEVQKAAVYQATGDDLAWHDIETNGYWMDANVVVESNNGTEDYKVVYIIFYAKGDSVKAISGSHNLV